MTPMPLPPLAIVMGVNATDVLLAQCLDEILVIPAVVMKQKDYHFVRVEISTGTLTGTGT